MVSPALPPIDIILLMVLWAGVGITWAVIAICRTTNGWCVAACCCCCWPETCLNVSCGKVASEEDTQKTAPTEVQLTQQQQQQQPGNYEATTGDNNQQQQQQGGGQAAITVLQDQQQQQNSSSEPPTMKDHIITGLIGLVGSFIIALLVTVIIFAILGGAGFLDVLLFAPAKASTCVDTCTFETKDGLDGWATDQACCSYTMNLETSLGIKTKHDLYLKYSVNGTDAVSSFVIHAWILINSTLHWSAPTNQKPLFLLYNHGSGVNVASAYRLQRYKHLLASGNTAILVYDYAGYGKSTGTTNVANTLASANAVAHYMTQYFTHVSNLSDTALFVSTSSASGGQIPLGASLTEPTSVGVSSNAASGPDMSNFVVLGRSMGGGVGSYTSKIASSKPKGMILQSTFSSLAKLALWYFPMFGGIWASEADSTYARFSTVDNVKGYNQCSFHVHGTADTWVPVEMATEINDAMKSTYTSSCSEFYKLEGVKHTQPMTMFERQKIFEWLLARH